MHFCHGNGGVAGVTVALWRQAPTELVVVVKVSSCWLGDHI